MWISFSCWVMDVCCNLNIEIQKTVWRKLDRISGSIVKILLYSIFKRCNIRANLSPSRMETNHRGQREGNQREKEEIVYRLARYCSRKLKCQRTKIKHVELSANAHHRIFIAAIWLLLEYLSFDSDKTAFSTKLSATGQSSSSIAYDTQ